MDCNDLRADSLPDPGPETSIFNDLTPYSFAFVPTSSAAICAANGVDFLEPLKPLWRRKAAAGPTPLSGPLHGCRSSCKRLARLQSHATLKLL